MSNFTISKKGGYDQTEVDSYISSLESQLNDYKDKSSAIYKAIISAQLASDKMIKSASDEASSIIKAANEKKEKLLIDAKNMVNNIKRETSDQLDQLRNNISQQRELINNLQKDYAQLQEKYLQSIQKADVNVMLNRLNEVEALLKNFEKIE